MTTERMLTVTELTQSEEFGWFFTSVSKVYRAVREHGLPYAAPSGKMLFAPEKLRKWMQRDNCGHCRVQNLGGGSFRLKSGKVVAVRMPGQVA